MYEFVQKEVDIIESRRNHTGESIKKLETIACMTPHANHSIVDSERYRKVDRDESQQAQSLREGIDKIESLTMTTNILIERRQSIISNIWRKRKKEESVLGQVMNPFTEEDEAPGDSSGDNKNWSSVIVASEI